MLTPLSIEWKENNVQGDINIVSAVFLVLKDKEAEFDKAVTNLENMYGKRKQIKYIRSPIPYNFVEIVIHWEEE
jgi:hypothetical protein